MRGLKGLTVLCNNVLFALQVQPKLYLSKGFTGIIKKLYKTVHLAIEGINLQAELPCLDNNLLFWRLANPKGRDDMRLWIHHLIAQADADTNKGSIITQGIFRGEKQAAIQIVQFKPVESPQQLLTQLIQCYKNGMQQPLLLNASLGQKHCLKKNGKTKPLDDFTFKLFWEDQFKIPGLGSDSYVHWFWSGKSRQIPQWQGDWKEHVEAIYSTLYEYRQVILSN